LEEGIWNLKPSPIYLLELSKTFGRHTFWRNVLDIHCIKPFKGLSDQSVFLTDEGLLTVFKSGRESLNFLHKLALDFSA
jgi:hypothetical protein